jgi:hypothetical protein
MKSEQVVLDPSLTRALLWMAAKEKLISEKGETDGYFANLLRSEPPLWVQQQMLEQIALFPRIMALGGRERDWLDGPLFEELDLTFGKAAKNDELPAREISADIIDGMLRAEGIEIPMTDYKSRMANMKTALDERDEFEREHGEKAPTYLEAMIRSTVDRAYAESPEFQKVERWHNMCEPGMPLINVAQRFIDHALYSEKQGACFKTPVVEHGSLMATIPPKGPESERLTHLFRLTTLELGTLPYRRTLHETLKLAKKTASRDLRVRLWDWLQEIESGKLDDAEKILRDIHLATAHLQAGQVSGKIGGFCTYLGGGLTGLGLGASGGLAAALTSLGVTVTIVGVIAQGKADLGPRSHRWASFGSR